VAQEDMELGYRLRRAGMRVVQSPGALGYHHHEVTLEGLARRAYLQGYNYHYLEDNVPELWIRLKTGHVELADGVGLFARTRLKSWLRRGIVNGATLRGVVYPLIRAAARFPFLRPLVPSLCGKVTLYHFHLGLRDYSASRAADLARVVTA
jgi:GT2 family glycosyltransferase